MAENKEMKTSQNFTPITKNKEQTDYKISGSVKDGGKKVKMYHQKYPTKTIAEQIKFRLLAIKQIIR